MKCFSFYSNKVKSVRYSPFCLKVLVIFSSLLPSYRWFTPECFSAVQISSVEFLQFDFDTIIEATNNFYDDNKLGQGGFGEVYKVL